MAVATAAARPPPPLDTNMVEHAVDVFTKSPDPIAKTNASGMLGFLASTRPEACSAIARCDGVVESVAAELANASNASHDMQHNVALLVGQLARGSHAFRRKFADNVEAMDALISLLQGSDSDTVCNTLWGLRHLVSGGIHSDPVRRKQTAAIIKPLTQSADTRIATNAKAVADTLQRPVPIDTSSAEDAEAAAGLASILHTPPPSGAPRPLEPVETKAPTQRPAKRKSSPSPARRKSSPSPAPPQQEPINFSRGESRGERLSKRLARRGEDKPANDEPSGTPPPAPAASPAPAPAANNEGEPNRPGEVALEDDEAAGALACLLVQAAEG